MEPETTTITEALAELATIDKRINKKRQFVMQHLLRQEAMKDPLDRDGGSMKAIRAERQSIGDLLERKIRLRQAIQRANTETQITVGGVTRTIADWLVWRRDVAPLYSAFLQEMNTRIETMRQEATRKGLTVVATEPTKPTDVIVNISEAELAREIEALEETLGRLDGLLSLKNATIMIAL